MITKLFVSILFGSACGSFAALVADRVPRGESVVVGRSTCAGCDRRLSVRELVPVLSWIALRARCVSCGASIGSTTLVVEVLTAGLFALCALRIDDPIELIAHWVLCTGLMSLSVIDLFTMRLPRRIIHVTAGVGAPLLLAATVSMGEPHRITAALAGSVGALAAMWILYVVSFGRMGDGDVRLSPLLGLYLGWRESSAVFTGFFLAFVLGAVVGIAVIAARHRDSHRLESSCAIPFGPFLAIGTIAALLFDLDFLVFG